MVGRTYSIDFPTANPLQPNNAGEIDVFVTRIYHEAEPTAGPVTITYTYDPLYRLTGADYSTGEYFHYTYDEVGNRLTQETHQGSNTYLYDDGNRLIEVDGVPYAWDAKGNLLDDGVRSYTYDHANRLTNLIVGQDSYMSTYNGIGNRLTLTMNEDVTKQTLDYRSGLMQVISEGDTQFLYGVGRIGEKRSGGWQYYLTDALTSVRQLINASGETTASSSYGPYGSYQKSSGDTITVYGYSGEWTDGSRLVYLRARFYSPEIGIFTSINPISGTPLFPKSFQQYT